jgi:phosphoribosylamine--glycine ligase
MKTKDGIKVIEFNCRFGDPETEVVLPRLESDIYEIFCDIADGKPVGELKWKDESVMGFVMASKGYPGKYVKGKEITGLNDALSDPDVKIYHMGTTVRKASDLDEGRCLTNGGRVLMVLASGKTPQEAHDKALAAVKKIHCDNLFYRSDIGHWAL